MGPVSASYSLHLYITITLRLRANEIIPPSGYKGAQLCEPRAARLQGCKGQVSITSVCLSVKSTGENPNNIILQHPRLGVVRPLTLQVKVTSTEELQVAAEPLDKASRKSALPNRISWLRSRWTRRRFRAHYLTEQAGSGAVGQGVALEPMPHRTSWLRSRWTRRRLRAHASQNKLTQEPLDKALLKSPCLTE
jgi:hypothetical protein